MGSLEDRASADGELLAAILALMVAVIALPTSPLALAVRTDNHVRPSSLFYIFNSRPLIRVSAKKLKCADCCSLVVSHFSCISLPVIFYSINDLVCEVRYIIPKMRLGRWKCLGVVGATLPLWIPAPYRGTGHAFDRRNDEFGGGNHSFSYQSLMPAGAGTPRYEKPELWLGTANWHGRFCHAPPRPLRGTSPRATFSHSAIDHRSTVRHVSPAESRHRG